MGKPRVNIRISTKLYAQLCEAADRPGATKTAIVEDALRAWFDPEARSVLEERLLARVDAFDRRQAEIERDIAHALGQKRFDHFIGQVARKIGGRDTRNIDR